MKHITKLQILVSLLMLFFISTSVSYAQTAESEKTLKDIFTEQEAKKNKTGPVTAEDWAGQFFAKCASNEKTLFNKATQESYCACKAEKIAQYLTVPQIKVLEEDSKEGAYARGLMNMHADGPCMPDAVKKYTRDICMQDKNFKTLLKGKSVICKCVGDQIKHYVNKHAPHVVTRAVKFDPLTLDPIMFFLMDDDYNSNLVSSKQSCYNTYIYSDNGQTK